MVVPGQQKSPAVVIDAMEMFRSGKSKAEIGKVLGKSKKAVAKLLALEIRERSSNGTR